MDEKIYDWIFGVNPTNYNGFSISCRGNINQAISFFAQIRSRGVFRAQGGYPLNRLLFDINDITITALRDDNGQQDQSAVDSLIAQIGAVIA